MLRKLKITTRLMAGFGTLTLLIALLAGLSIVSGEDIQASYSRMHRTLNDQILGDRVVRQLYEARMYVWKGLAISNDDPAHVGLWAKASDAVKAAKKTQEELLAATVTPSRQAKGARLGQMLDGYMVKLADIQAMDERGEELTSSDARAKLADAAAAATAINDLANELSAEFRQVGEESAAKTDTLIADDINSAIVVGILAVILGVGFAVGIARSIAHPITQMTGSMEQLAGGQLDMVVPCTEQGGEIGGMARTLQVFQDNARQVEALRRQQAETEVRAAAERKKAMHDLADQFESTVMGVVTVVSSSAVQMQSTAQSLSASAHQATSQATAVASASEQASSNVQTVASATEQLSASISEIASQVGQAASISETAASETERTNARVEALAEAAARIGEVVNLINSIASQTNLLALNATIEAARAGDAGKGFAVVAGEVKNLANQTAKATEEIGSQIASIQAETKNAVDAIRNIGGIIDQVRNISGGISDAVEQQRAATSEIARNVQEAAQGTELVTNNIISVSEAATHTGGAASQVLSSSGLLAQNSGRLKDEVVRFLQNVRAA